MNPPAISQRLAVPADGDLLLRLIAAYYAHDHLTFDASTMRAGLASLLADPRIGRAYLIERDGAVLGYALITFGFDLEFGGRLATLTDLYLEPGARRSGVGSETLRFLAAECEALGVQALQLEVEQANLPAQGLYRKLGFQPLPRLPMLKRL